MSRIIHRTREGQRYEYGVNWEWNERWCRFVLFLPIWIKMEKIYFKDFDEYGIHFGKRLQIASVSFRLRFVGTCNWWERLIFHIRFGERAYNPTFLLSREEAEDNEWDIENIPYVGI